MDVRAAALAAFDAMGLTHDPMAGFEKSVPERYHQEYSQYMADAPMEVIWAAKERFERLGWACYYDPQADFLYVYEPTE